MRRLQIPVASERGIHSAPIESGPRTVAGELQASGTVIAWSDALAKCLVLLRSGKILLGLGVDRDDVAFGHKVRHLNHQTSFSGGGFQGIRHRGALHSWVSSYYFEIYRLRHRDIERCTIKELDLNLSVGREEAFDIFDHLARQRDLVVGFSVHEMELIAFTVEKLHLDLIENHALDPILRAEPVLGLAAGLDIAQLGLHHTTPVPRGNVTDSHYAPEGSVVIENHPGP